MLRNIYESIYIIMTIVGVVILDGYFRTLLGNRIAAKKWYVLSYVTYIVLTFLLHYKFPYVLINLGFSIVSFFALSFLYRSTIKNRLLVSVSIYMILSCVEVLVALVAQTVDSSMVGNTLITYCYGIIIMKIISLIILFFIKNYFRMKRMNELPGRYWVGVLSIPVSSIVILMLLFEITNYRTVELFLCVVLILLMNIAVFYIYDVLLESFDREVKRRLLMNQSECFKQQLELMNTSITTTNALWHDLKNHMIVLNSYMSNQQYEAGSAYIEEILHYCQDSRTYVNSGNFVIDSILNFKLQLLDQKNIQPELEIRVPKDLPIEAFDLTIILGNLIDNAIEGACTLEENRKLGIKITYNRNRLLVFIENPFNGVCKKVGEELASTKEDSIGHGYGLRNVKNAIERYEGSLQIHTDNQIFSVFAMLYCE